MEHKNFNKTIISQNKELFENLDNASHDTFMSFIKNTLHNIVQVI
jgi:hypothetical protein